MEGFEEVGYFNVEEISNLEQTPRRQPVGAVLVFLSLLESNAKGFSKDILTDAQLNSFLADTSCYVSGQLVVGLSDGLRLSC